MHVGKSPIDGTLIPPNVMDEEKIGSSAIYPCSLRLQCQVQVFQQSAWGSSLLQSMFDLVNCRAHMNDFIEMVGCARTSTFMKTAAVYKEHVNYYCAMQTSAQRLLSQPPAVMKFPDFPAMLKHCGGYNATLGPSRVQAKELFPRIVNQQLSLLNRYQGGLVGTHLSSQRSRSYDGI